MPRPPTSPLLLSPTSNINLTSFHFKKEQTSKRGQPNRAEQDRKRQGESLHIEVEQGNVIGGKVSHDQAKESGLHLLPLLGVPQKHQANNHNTECLIRTPVVPMLANFISVSPYEPCLVESVGLVLIFSNNFDSYSLSSPSSLMIPELQ